MAVAGMRKQDFENYLAFLMTYYGVVPQGAPEAPRRNLAININKVRLFNALSTLAPPAAAAAAVCLYSKKVPNLTNLKNGFISYR